MAFFEFNLAISGLFAAQRGLQVTSNNITNANTTGYSRQELKQQASSPLKGLGVGMTGTGVDITGVNRVRDSYIDQKLWAQSPKQGEYDIKVVQNSVIESAFNEPSKTGFTAVFEDMFSSFSDLCEDKNNKSVAVQTMNTFANYYTNISATLSHQQQTMNFDLKNTVNEINSLSTRIRSLNEQILNAEMYGDEASTFRDERDNCLDRLSKIIDIEVEETEYNIKNNTIKKMTVKAAGQTLVDHIHCNTLDIVVRGEAERKIDTLISTLKDVYEGTNTTDTEEAILNKLNTIGNVTINKDAGGNVTSIDFDARNGEKIRILEKNAGNVTTMNAGDGKLHPDDVDGLYDIKWHNGMYFDMADANMSGELKGIIDIRDGCGTGTENDYAGIPYYIKRLNQYVQGFAKQMNEQYSRTEEGYIEIYSYEVNSETASYFERTKEGDMIFRDANKEIIATAKVDSDGNFEKLVNKNGLDTGMTADEVKALCNGYATKYALFTYKTGDSDGVPVSAEKLNDYSKINSLNFSISKELYNDATSMRVVYDKDEPSNNSFLLNLLAQKDNKHMFKEGDPKDYMVAIFAELGINAKEASMYQNTQSSMVRNLTNQRLSVSQVDISEEFTYLIKYQQAYQAAAKIMTTIDSIYETTIFKLGNF